MRYTLGLDLGPASIGWCAVRVTGASIPESILDAGVRIFQEAVDAKSRLPKNIARRAKRQLRRQLRRRRERMHALKGHLQAAGLLPAEVFRPGDVEGLWNRLGNPYQLRAEGLDRELTLLEFGRAILHLARRRGFLSNRKAQRKTDEDGTATDAGISALQEAIAAAGCRTLGAYLHRCPVQRNRDGQRPYYTARAMLLHEFDLLWQSQVRWHATVLTDALRLRLHRAIFFQRPLRSQAGTIGLCPLEQSVGKDRARAAWAWPEVQRFRILQQVNHLRLIHPRQPLGEALTAAERAALVAALSIKAHLTWSQARRILGKIRGVTPPESQQFNLEQGGHDKLIGDRTGSALRGVLDDDYEALAHADRHALVEDLLTIDNEDGLLRRLQERWDVDRQTAVALGKARLEEKPCRLSLRAVRRLLPHLEAGLRYDEAVEAAGYLRRDQQSVGTQTRLGQPPNLRNPVVGKALHEVRRVVNALIRTHGKPIAIRIEMARDLKLTGKDKTAYELNAKRNERANAEADAFWRQIFNQAEGYQASHDDRVKWRLWRDQGETCPYTGQTLSAAMLASDAVQIDHILPFSRTLDDSFGNKVACLSQANAEKGNRTPWEWLAGDQTRFEAMLVRVEHMRQFSPAKRRRFALNGEEFATAYGGERDFVARQLNDTRWICRAVKDYLGQLAGVDIEVSKGEATAALRHQWGLNPLLSDSMEKNRADHRHHAVDACVVACTGRDVFLRIALASHRARGDGWRHRIVEAPWPTFRADLASRLAGILVSHAANRRIIGGFHEDTAYGVASEADGKLLLVYRKPLTSLTGSLAAEIRDEAVRTLVLDRVRDNGLDPARFTAKEAAALFGPDDPLLHRDGVTPIRTVRILRRNCAAKGVYRRGRTAYDLGNNHHVEIVRDPATGRCLGRFVSALEAARRARREHKEPVDRAIGTPFVFICALHTNDLVEVPDGDEKRYYRVQSLDGSNGVVCLRLATAATLGDKAHRLLLTPNSLISKGIRKISVDALGRVRPDDQARGGDRQPGPAAPGTAATPHRP